MSSVLCVLGSAVVLLLAFWPSAPTSASASEALATAAKRKTTRNFRLLLLLTDDSPPVYFCARRNRARARVREKWEQPRGVLRRGGGSGDLHLAAEGVCQLRTCSVRHSFAQRSPRCTDFFQLPGRSGARRPCQASVPGRINWPRCGPE